jgi:hypothetical protein
MGGGGGVPCPKFKLADFSASRPTLARVGVGDSVIAVTGDEEGLEGYRRGKSASRSRMPCATITGVARRAFA